MTTKIIASLVGFPTFQYKLLKKILDFFTPIRTNECNDSGHLKNPTTKTTKPQKASLKK